jgi:AraC-like DNA-binding protein
LLVGYCVFGSPDAALLVSLLPQLVHVRGERRLATLVQLVGEESRELGGVAEVAQRVGYSSASTFSVAFTRYVGLPPARYARLG